MWQIFVKYFFKHFKSQIILICLIAEVVIITLFIFGVKLEFIGENLVGIGVFSEKMRYDMSFIKTFIDTVTSILFTIFIFLYIVGGSEFPSNLMNDPLLGVILALGVTRRKIYISRFLGLYLAYILNALVFSLLIFLIIFFKGNFKVLNFAPLYIFLSFSLTFSVVELFISLIGILTKNSLVSSVFGILIYFFLLPLLFAHKDTNLLISIFYYIIPSAYAVKDEFMNLIYGGDFSLFDFVIPLFGSVVYFTIGMEIFNRKEI